MKKLSLRMRLTITVIIIITAIALMLTLVAMYNSGVINTAMSQTYDVVYAEMDSALIEGNYNADDIGDFIVEGVPASLHLEGSESYNTYSVEASPALPLFPFATGVAAVNTDPAFPEGVSISFSAVQSSFNINSIIFMLIIIAAGGIITWFALGKAMKPVRQLSEEIEGITENELDVRVTSFQSRDEVGTLAASFNLLMERLEKAFSEQREFATSAAHELKTPLAAIKANIGVLEMDSDPTSEEYKQTIAVVKKQMDRMAKLVDDLLCVSSGDYETEDAVEVGSVIDTVLSDLAHKAKEKDLDIHVNTQLKNTASTNKAMLQRVLSNVIGNAVRYTQNHGRIEISAKENSSGFMIVVADNGPGIDEKNREKVFLPFFRVDDSRSRKAGGAGLGLAIAKSMVEKLGGSIELAPNKPSGSIFTVEIPKL
ncbi:MAG: sensor histidine kinase [Christensenellaceae bacterium]|jgi:signal transduction histidine kinase